MKQIAVGVAGHVDHGKTALVRALTGIETDRLKEEQEHGMSIVLGFAHVAVPEGEIDLIDVPGHEKFIHTMIAGASGIEALLLVVDSQEGIMPQTLEHLALAELLGVKYGILVVAKSDLVPDATERKRCEAKLQEGLSDTRFHNSAPIWTSAVTGEGLDTLHCKLHQLLKESEPPRDIGRAYLPIDRAFSITGHGTIVTGTLRYGSVSLGQPLQLVPQGQRVEIKGLEVHGKPVGKAVPGQRVAINLRGLKKEEVSRGNALSEPDTLLPTTLLDIQLQALPTSSPLRTAAQVRLHFGTHDCLARVYPLESEQINPSEAGVAQLRLAEEVFVPYGERLVLRAVSPAQTLGGGVVVDPNPHRHNRHNLESVRHVQALVSGNITDAIDAKLTEAGASGWHCHRLACSLGLTDYELQDALQSMDLMICGDLVALKSILVQLQGRVKEIVMQFHESHPTHRGIKREELRNRLPHTLAPLLFGYVVDNLAHEKAIQISDNLLSLYGFSPENALSPVERAIADELENSILKGGLKPPNLSDLLGTDRRKKNLYHYLRESGRLLETVDRTNNRLIVFHAVAVATAVSKLQDALAGNKELSVSEINQLLGTSRKYSIPLLEYFDTARLTERQGDLRTWRGLNTDTKVIEEEVIA